MIRSSGRDLTGGMPDDVAGTCDALAAAHADLIAVETRQLQLAAHWIDLHCHVEEPDGERPDRTFPGTERSVPAGADGTPLISEFACAEFAALHDMHPLAGAALLRKVANLRHRHPVLWRRALAGDVRVWKALETARLVGRTELGLTLEQARWIDEHSCEWVTTLPWGSYVDLVERLIIDADPEAAETRRLEAESRQGVWTGQSSEHGLRTIVARAGAGEVVYLVAVIDRIAEILTTKGDLREIGPRRAAALAILAHPAHALSLLAEHVVDAADASTDPSAPDTTDPSAPDTIDSEDPEPRRPSSACPTRSRRRWPGSEGSAARASAGCFHPRRSTSTWTAPTSTPARVRPSSRESDRSPTTKPASGSATAGSG